MSSETRRYQLKARARSQEDTRRRIIETTMGLHAEVGPARTTVAEIARRAGVQRLTVYNHFPEDAELVAACQAHWLDLNPPPDFAAALSRPQAADAVRAALAQLYSWYDATQNMAENVQRDRARMPALDALLRSTADAQLDALGAGIAGRASGEPTAALAALANLAVSFWTWRTLHRSGLDAGAAAAVMTDALLTAGA
ncbi:hypothetical protein GCM10028798_13590 [Humibacter antri]